MSGNESVEVVGRDAELSGVIFHVVVFAEFAVGQSDETFPIAVRSHPRRRKCPGCGIFRAVQQHQKLVEHGPQDVLILVLRGSHLFLHLQEQLPQPFLQRCIGEKKRRGPVCLQIG